MMFVTEFLFAMLGVSALLWGAAHLYQRLDTRIEQWPGLWAVSQFCAVLIPVFGLILSLFPNWVPVEAVNLLPRHWALDPVTWPSSIEPNQPASIGTALIGAAWAGLVWLYGLGVCVMAGRLALGRYRIRRIVRSAVPFGRSGDVTILLSSRVQSPFAWTPFGRADRAYIIIPRRFARQMTSSQIDHIALHERAHIVRRDDEMGLLLRGLLCLCWVSPFAHSLFARWSQATEIQCDMAVTQGRSPQMRRAYADTLLQALHIVAGRVRQYPAASFSTHRLRNEKMRITHIVNGSAVTFKCARDRMMLGLAAACVTSLGTLTIASTANARGDQASAAKSVVSEIVSGRLTAKFGKSHDPFKSGDPVVHRGVDIAAPFGTPIHAPEAGTILAATNIYDGKPGYGNVVVIQTDDGTKTMFAHLQGYTVREGQRVTKGEQIATVGSSGKSTGPHVHIETQKDGALVDPMSVWGLAPR